MIGLNEIPAGNAPMDLLLIADPSIVSIQRYLEGARCFVATAQVEMGQSDIVAVAICQTVGSNRVELFNLAVAERFQGQGIGARLIAYLLEELRLNGVREVVLGTGAFGYQLTFYHRAGFRVESVIRDHFLTHYSEPIIENGIQHKDMLRLICHL